MIRPKRVESLPLLLSVLASVACTPSRTPSAVHRQETDVPHVVIDVPTRDVLALAAETSVAPKEHKETGAAWVTRPIPKETVATTMQPTAHVAAGDDRNAVKTSLAQRGFIPLREPNVFVSGVEAREYFPSESDPNNGFAPPDPVLIVDADERVREISPPNKSCSSILWDQSILAVCPNFDSGKLAFWKNDGFSEWVSLGDTPMPWTRAVFAPPDVDPLALANVPNPMLEQLVRIGRDGASLFVNAPCESASALDASLSRMPSCWYYHGEWHPEPGNETETIELVLSDVRLIWSELTVDPKHSIRNQRALLALRPNDRSQERLSLMHTLSIGSSWNVKSSPDGTLVVVPHAMGTNKMLIGNASEGLDRVNSLPERTLSITMADRIHGVALNGIGLSHTWVTRDGGQTWESLANLGPDPHESDGGLPHVSCTRRGCLVPGLAVWAPPAIADAWIHPRRPFRANPR